MTKKNSGAGLDLALEYNLDNRVAGRSTQANPRGLSCPDPNYLESATMNIQVLYFEGCPNYKATLDLVHSVAGSAAIEAVQIRTQEDAVRMRFLGSPTILVDGVDVEPDARTRTDFGFTCRTYGGSGVPSRGLVASAIESCSPSWTARPVRNWYAGSSIAVAAIASACCWLPLVLLALGMPTVGLSSSFEAFRPWLLSGSAILLVAGFYSAYRKQACCTPRARRLSRAMVWIAAVLVATFALFPLYAGALVDQIEGPACCTSSEQACCTSPQTDTTSVQYIALTKQKTAVTVLSKDAHELKDAFNADKNAPRVMLIVSPLCPACRAGASVVQKAALARTDSDELKVYVVWINRFPGDSLKAAQAATQLVSDKRALHFWDGTGAVGKLYGKTVKLPRDKTFAWDVYFVFGPKAKWDASPPVPEFWMHQLGGPETGNMLEGAKFQEVVVKQLRGQP
jgi:hypothetical protein